jgi:hypothetical protein
MLRHYLCAVSAFLALVCFVVPAQAGIGWCKTDPIVLIDGQIADIFVSAPLDAPLRVTGPTVIVVTLPVGVVGAVVLTDLGFGRGEQVSFNSSHALRVTADGIQVRIAVYVPATTHDMPVRVEFAPRLLGLLDPDSVDGMANAWVILRSVA